MPSSETARSCLWAGDRARRLHHPRPGAGPLRRARRPARRPFDPARPAAAGRADDAARDARAARSRDRAPRGGGRPSTRARSRRSCLLSEHEQDLASTAGLLHDIGKFALPDRILHADDLPDEDWARVRRHPQDGATLVGRLDGYGPVADAILYHHERVDGSGYPAGLIGREIPRWRASSPSARSTTR